MSRSIRMLTREYSKLVWETNFFVFETDEKQDGKQDHVRLLRNPETSMKGSSGQCKFR
jgi:hypothetical protein